MAALPPQHVIAEGLAHPLRLRILAAFDALDGREASVLEIADTIGEDLRHVSYHVRQLAAHGLIAQTRTGQVKGALQHFYRLAVRARIEAEHAAH